MDISNNINLGKSNRGNVRNVNEGGGSNILSKYFIDESTPSRGIYKMKTIETNRRSFNGKRNIIAVDTETNKEIDLSDGGVRRIINGVVENLKTMVNSEHKVNFTFFFEYEKDGMYQYFSAMTNFYSILGQDKVDAIFEKYKQLKRNGEEVYEGGAYRLVFIELNLFDMSFDRKLKNHKSKSKDKRTKFENELNKSKEKEYKKMDEKIKYNSYFIADKKIKNIKKKLQVVNERRETRRNKDMRSKYLKDLDRYETEMNLLIDNEKLTNEIKLKFDNIIEKKNKKRPVESKRNETRGNKKKNTNQNNNINEKKGGFYVELPLFLKTKHSILNIKNRDEMCFIWCVLAGLYPIKENATRVVHYKKHFKSLDTSMIDFPVNITTIPVFADANNLNISVWELLLPEFDDKLDEENISLKCILKTMNRKEDNTIIKLLLYNGHYMLIKDIELLLRTVCSLSYKPIFCEKCQDCYFSNLSAYQKHLKICMKNDSDLNFEMPSSFGDIYYKNFKNEFKAGYVIYADYEAILESTSIHFGKGSEKTSKHKEIAIGMVQVESFKDEICEEYIYGENCTSIFIDKLFDITLKISTERSCFIDRFKESTVKSNETCSICKHSFDDTKTCVVIANEIATNFKTLKCHKTCAFMFSGKIFSLTIFFHNLKGYDSHFIVDEFAKRCREFFVIPVSREKYISFQGKINECNVKFLDSMSFINGSIASNAARLKEFKYMGSHLPKSNLPLGSLLNYVKKQAFPYEYVTSREILENEGLPTDKSKWYSSLTGKETSIEDIEFALKTCEIMNFKNIKEYMMFYLRIDVLLLLEIYESFRKMTINEYGLDPVHYFTTPGMAWDAAMKSTGIRLELLKTDEMVRFFCERGTIRGGISTVSEKKWGVSSDNSSVFYFDVTNLYGFAMTFPLPYGGFEFVDKSIMNDLLYEWKIDDKFGYILEVDIYVPSELHDKFNELPFLAEHYDGKLIPTLLNKTNYRIHIYVLQQAIRHGLILKDIKKVMKFKQKRWLKDYIEHNTNMRAATTDENMRNFFKLMNNAVYGKTMENIFNRCKYTIFQKNDEVKLKRMVKKNKIEGISNLTENIIIGKRNEIPKFDKPVYVGFAILELSKHHMYFILYDVIKPKWPSSKLMYM